MTDARLAVSAYLDGERDPAAVAVLRRSLLADPALLADARSQARVSCLLRAVHAPQEDPALADSVMRLIRAGRTSRKLHTAHAVGLRLRRRRRPHGVPVWLLAAAAALLLVLGGIWMVVGQTPPPSVLPAAPDAPVAVTPLPVPIVVTVAEATAAQLADGQPLQAGMPLTAGAHVAVAAAGHLTLACDGARIDLAGGATATLVAPRRIGLDAGRMLVATGQLGANGGHLDIVTPYGLVTTQGTLFDATLAGDGLALRLRDGHLAVTNAHGSARLDPWSQMRLSGDAAPSTGTPLGMAQRPGHWRYAFDGSAGVCDAPVASFDGQTTLLSRARAVGGGAQREAVVFWSGDRMVPLIRTLPGSVLRLRVRTDAGGRVAITLSRIDDMHASSDPWVLIGDVACEPGVWQDLALPLATTWREDGQGESWDGSAIDSISCWGSDSGAVRITAPAIDVLER